MDMDTIGGLLTGEGVRVRVRGGSPSFVGAVPTPALKGIVVAHRDLFVALGDGLYPVPPVPPWRACEKCKADVRRYPDCNAGQTCEEFPCPERK